MSGRGYLAISIFENGSNWLPAQQIYSQQGYWDSPVNNTTPQWNGISNLNWILPAGTYWIGYASNSSLTVSMPFGVTPSPSLIWAFDSSYSDGNWHLTGPGVSQIGVRVEGVVAPVPLPAAGLLFTPLLSLFAVGAGRRRIYSGRCT